MKADRKHGEDEGQSEDEVALYDALAESQKAVSAMGNDTLEVIAHELLASLEGNINLDWARREGARARMRVLVNRILRTYGYPSDLQDGAVHTLPRQAEALSFAWTV